MPPVTSRCWSRARYLDRIRRAIRRTPCCCRSCPPPSGAAAARLLRRPGGRDDGRLLPRSAAEVPAADPHRSNCPLRRPLPLLLPAPFPLARRTDEACWSWGRPSSEIAADPSIHEVILSGGDPLTLADEYLARLAGRLAEIPHLRRLRVHTRMPIVIPQRVPTGCSAGCGRPGWRPLMVVHVNHPAEIDAAGGRRPGPAGRRRRAAAEPDGAVARGQRSVEFWPSCSSGWSTSGDAVLPAPVGPRGRDGPFRGARSAGAAS